MPINRRTDKLWYIHTIIYYLAVKRTITFDNMDKS